MSRNSRPAWVQSLSTIPDLPECPADLAEPTFVRLAFEPRCFVSLLIICLDVTKVMPEMPFAWCPDGLLGAVPPGLLKLRQDR
jgi:hypothetical protein